VQSRTNGFGGGGAQRGEPDVDEMIQDAERMGSGGGGNGMEDMDDDVLPVMGADDIDVELGAAGRNWERPPPPPLDPNRDPLIFQQLELDYAMGPPRASVARSDLSLTPIIRMFGVTEAGNSVCTFVHGFLPYLYVEAPRQDFGPEDCESLRLILERLLSARKRDSLPKCIMEVKGVQRQTLKFYQPRDSRLYIKITVALPTHIAPLKAILDAGILLDFEDESHPRAFQTFESNVLFALRFMVDTDIVGGNWIELPASKYITVAASHPEKESHCQLEAHVHWKDLISHAPEGEWAKMAPFRILSTDIECAGRKGHFPEAEVDPVIQIASLVTVQGDKSPVVKNILTLNDCAQIIGAEVMSFNTERELLNRWRDLVVETDPDIIIGYNICNFDLPYLLNRATALNLKDFPYWGRMRRRAIQMKDAQFSSKAYGTHDYKEITCEGRTQFDLLTAIQRDHKLSSYSLNAVSAHFLGEQKEDVHHSIISDLQAGNAESRRRLAVYCLKDAYLPQRLVDKLMYMYNYIEMARVTGVPMSFLLTKGQSIKVFSQLLRKAKQRNLVIPFARPTGSNPDAIGYEGATVLDAQVGYYREPVATLDFASLYPSIMMAHNLCYSTLLTPDAVKQYSPEQYTKSPTGDCFVKPSLKKGILPEVLEELLAARKRAKADLKKATDPFVKAVLDGRQLALKVSANSVYGFTGATIGKLPCLEISASTTAYGRLMIEQTREAVMAKYNKANGYEADSEVIYGDTDSVMVNFKVTDISRAMELGREAAEVVSDTFVKPIRLEFEKVYCPYLLISKKRYAGLLYTTPDKHDKMDTKGIETVRRDNCLLVKNVVTTSLEKMLIDKDVEGAVSYVKGVISDLLMNRMDLSLLVVSKGLTKAFDEYDAKGAHVELAKKMMKRDPATAPTVGDRVPYVIIKAAKGAKTYEKAEDPIYALEHNLPIDCQHYLEHHLSLPLTRIFDPIMKNAKDLLNGEHTRSIAVTTPSNVKGGIMAFAKKKVSCLGCKAPIASGTLCDHCAPKEGEVYQRSIAAVNELESQFGALWTQCQRCQGSLHQDVLCTSRDCPIFYRRKKVQKDLMEAHVTVARFDDGNW